MTATMTASVMFRDADARARMQDWSQRFRAKTPGARPVVVDTRFGATHALVAGAADAPPLVVLHGALATSAHVLPELGPLLDTHRVYAIDVIGQSAMSADRRLNLADESYGQWLREATAALGLDRFDLYGASWGGFVALRGAIAAPDSVRRLVLLVPAGLVGNSPWAGLRDIGWPLLRYRLRPSAASLQRVVSALCTTLDPDWTAYFGDALAAYRLDLRVPPVANDAALARLTCPALVFGATHDVHFPGGALIARARTAFPHVEVELLDGVKHCPPFTDAFRTHIGERIERFLRAS